ncbi:choice-of-anchor K domain-containing protein [Aetokthonos hydrillicola Thurmond2011]|jgi:hypothetical protein|uniref:Choice-of-anchor K domain-containing protein n=1 Tax=Aetokthonos hydrillicola Thurmond2011 TaxID=2712845 RepID=A0AAP5MBZ6_9CYAN|nr:choice-of-anchor K domain-containing protein [Aetokthonos hydrillicola]MBO3461058.1 PEP-CTERM sorting domain-containing protein [Aetokthonos hydrillicola CCALA 1050]MBW4586311.1 choice-of-anchor K domain-containing protein [Aetokthonos hydrillicola CCALA 1050]MDR9897439.1 choice-of-anchor K domain-containing protein [Aetokthonos hydrillicola Thurmond2011]
MKFSSVFSAVVSTLAVTAVTALGFTNQAQALTFSGSSAGRWGTPTAGSINTNPVYTGVGTNSFTWGQAIPDDPNFGTPPNQLTFTGQSFSTETDSVFKVGQLAYFNGTVPEGTNVNSVPLNLRVSFNDPVSVNKVFDFNFNLVNTPNTSANPLDNADYVLITRNVSNSTFTFDDGQYTLELIGFSQDDGKTNVNDFRVLEGERTTANLFAKITKVSSRRQVPEPTHIIGLSVLGIYLVSRRQRLKVKSDA